MTFNRTLLYLALVFTAATTVQSLPHHREVEDRIPGSPELPSPMPRIRANSSPQDPNTAAISSHAPPRGHATPVHLAQHGGAVSSSVFDTSRVPNERGGLRRGRHTRYKATEAQDGSRSRPTVTAKSNRENERLTDSDRDRNQRTRTKGPLNRDGGKKEDRTEESRMAAARTTDTSASPASSSVDLLDAWGDRFISVANNLASALVDDTSSAAITSGLLSTSVSVSVTPADATTAPSPTNALDVLQSAIPSEVRQGLESVFPGVFDGESTSTRQRSTQSTTTSGERTRTRQPNRTTFTSVPTSRPNGQPTRRPGDRPNNPAHNGLPPQGFPNTTSTTSSTNPSTSSTTTIIPPTLTPPTDTPTGRPTPESADRGIGAHPIPTASVAGIASGLVAGAVIVFLGGAFLYRRRRAQGKPFLPYKIVRREKSQRSTGSGRVYPEVAWLYDPVISRPETPSGQHTRQGSDAPLVPGAGPRGSGGGASMSATGSARDVGRSYDEPLGTPEMGRGRRAESPLLAPQLPEIRVQRDESPFGERGGGGYLRLPGREDDQGA